MPLKANKISAKWLESKDAGKMNCINVKYVIGPHGEIAIGKKGLVKLNAQHHRSVVVDLLDWAPPPKETPCKQQKKGKDLEPNSGR